MIHNRKRVAILGATGYGGGELLRLLLQHPDVEVVHATSRNRAGVPVAAVHLNLQGITSLQFSNPGDEQLAAEADIIFGALPHKSAADVLAPLVDLGKTVIDLSGDFRLRSVAEYEKWYKHSHPRPDLLAEAVYGCPELNRDRIRTARLVASPGCFATSLNLALLPAAKAGLLRGTVNAVAMTGSSGSGAEAAPGTHHPTRAGTLRPYKVLSHQHVPECEQLVRDAGSAIDGISFIPVSAPLVRGILAVVNVELSTAMTTKQVEDLFIAAYANAPFVKVLTDREPECGPIAGTNFAEVRARVGADGRLHVSCAIDNLLKGGAGQAVESLDIMLDRSPLAPPLGWAGSWP